MFLLKQKVVLVLFVLWFIPKYKQHLTDYFTNGIRAEKSAKKFASGASHFYHGKIICRIFNHSEVMTRSEYFVDFTLLESSLRKEKEIHTSRNQIA